MLTTRQFILGSMLLLAGSLVSVKGVQAQESKTEKLFRTFRFGLFVGPTVNSLKPVASSADDYAITKGKGRIGFSFGINADYNINERYTIYTGLGLDWRGGNIEALHDSTKALPANYVKMADVSYKKMQYLSVPLGLKMKAFETGPWRVFAQTGFDLGLLLSQKGDYSIRYANDSTITRTNEKLGGIATVFPINLGWCIGAGTEYELNDKNSFYGAILYRNGFIDATTPQTNDKGQRFSDGNIRSNTWALRIGYFF